jgi:hypothetical protein
MVETANGSYCQHCGKMKFGRTITLYKPIKKFGDVYSSTGEWSSVKYEDAKVVGWMETEERVSE